MDAGVEPASNHVSPNDADQGKDHADTQLVSEGHLYSKPREHNNLCEYGKEPTDGYVDRNL